MLFSLTVIELSRPGLEATTYELLITVANAAGTVCYIIATQLLYPLNVTGCTDDYGDCSNTSVQVTSPSAFNDTDGPYRYTIYCVTLQIVSISACLFFTQFLPKDKQQCHDWRKEGELAGESRTRGFISAVLCTITISVSPLVDTQLCDHYLCFLVWIHCCDIALDSQHILLRCRGWIGLLGDEPEEDGEIGSL